MESLWNALKSLSIWQMVVLVAVLFGSGAAVYYVYLDRTRPETTELAENQQLIPIRYGDIVNQVSTNGNLAFPEREFVHFSIKGTIGTLLVAEGDTVSAGQELARLDTATVSALEETAAQARVDLLEAEEALEELLETQSEIVLALERAAAEEEIADVKHRIHLAQEALDEALDPEIPTLLDLETLKERIAATELQIQQLQDEREDLLNPVVILGTPTDTNQQVKAQEELIADARVKLQQAIDSKDELVTRNLEPDYERELAEARQGKVDAEKELASIEEALADLAPSQRQLLEASQARLKAEIALDAANQALDDFQDTHGSELSNRRRERAEVEADLTAAQNTLASLQEAYDSGTLGLSSNIQRWEAYTLNLTDELERVRFGIVSQEEELEADIALAETALTEAEELLAELEQGPDALERQALEARAEAIVANQEVADRDLEELERPAVDPQELALREARIVLAQANLGPGH